MKSLVRLAVAVFLAGPAVLSANGAFSSLYIFGDGVCSTTTTSNQPTQYYYGNRYCNGRVWLEVLAQRQGITFDSGKNLSYFYHNSTNLVAELNSFSAADASTALFVAWVCDADLVGDFENIYPSLDLNLWNSYLNRSLTNHYQTITNLYAKGARALVLPNAVDLTQIPRYSGTVTADRTFLRDRVISFNTNLAAIVNQARVSLPGLKIYSPDFFALLDDMLARPSDYGLVNAQYYGHTTGAVVDPTLADKSFNGPGAVYIFWDGYNPTAKANEIMADLTQQVVSPASLSLTVLSSSNRLDMTSLPIGLGGYVDARASVVSGNWAQVTNFISTNAAAAALLVPASSPPRFYRLRFPFAWTWP